MNLFNYTKAHTPEAAIAAAAALPGAKFIAGGTNLVDLMKSRIEEPPVLVDINPLAPLAQIELLPDGGLRVGALARNSDVAYDRSVRERYPVLSEALLSGASPQLRNMATVGGNLMQRTRCGYFHDAAFPCNKRTPGAGCSAIGGWTRMHAILGTSERCIAAHPSDMCVALAALDAVVQVRSASGERSIPFADFHLLPGDSPDRETSLGPGELITAVDLPDLPFAKNSRYLKVRDRASFDFALVSVAAALELRGGKIFSVRLALGGVGAKPWRAAAAERVLAGAAANSQTFAAAADAELKPAKTRRDNEFKTGLARRCIIRALELAARA